MNEKPLQVSDWSQPIKIIIFLVFFVALAVVGYFLLGKGERPLGVSMNEPNFNGNLGINATAICGGAAPATRLMASSTGRTSFLVSNTGANPVTVCRSTSTCANGVSGIILHSSSTSFFEQNDGYTGGYFCAAGVSTTVGITFSE